MASAKVGDGADKCTQCSRRAARAEIDLVRRCFAVNEVFAALFRDDAAVVGGNLAGFLEQLAGIADGGHVIPLCQRHCY